MAFTKLVDMERTDDEKLDSIASFPGAGPDYPYGLRICLCQEELDKLGLPKPDHGDYLDLRAFGRVTSITDDNGGCRVEIQIEKIAVESEDDEND